MTSAIKVRNPRTGVYDYALLPPTPEHVRACAAALRRANRIWQECGLDQRRRVLQQWRAAIAAREAEIVEALTVDTGRRLISAFEVQGVLSSIERWARLAPTLLAAPPEEETSVPTIKFRQQLVPYELVGVISPWNFPLTLALIDVIPALIAGCSVLLKPSEIAPRFCVPLLRTIADVPELAAVLVVLTGDGATGAALINEVDAVCFTGSVKTGRLVAEACARRLIPAFLELGGKDPAIVTASADLDVAAAALLRASVLATGQACQSLERIYVQETVYQAFTEKLVALAQAATLNYPDIHRGEIGPIIFAKQAEIISEQLADAVAAGALILCGGQIEELGGGKWLRPTVLINVTHEMQIMREETFGPVLPVMSYRDIDEAIQLANESAYGLSAAVFAGDEREAEMIARQVQAGAVSINDGALTNVVHEAEKNSFKLSGLGGSRMGATGLLRFFRKKALLFQRGTPVALAAFDEAQLNSPT